MKQVIVYYMHEEEMYLATQHVKSGNSTDSFVVGNAAEADIKLMLDRGLIVQEVVEDTSRNTPGNINFRGEANLKFSNRIKQAPAGKVMRGDFEHEIDLFAAQYYIIRVLGPILYEWLEALKQIDIELIEYIPTFKYKVLLDLQKLEKIRTLNFVKDVSLYDENDTGIITTKNLRSDGAIKETLVFDIRLHQNSELDKVLAWLTDKKVKIEGHGKKKIRVHIEQDSPLFKSIARLAEVATLEEYIEPKLFNDRARILMKLDSNPDNAAFDFEFEGQNQIVAVADTGIDVHHPDFQNRIDLAIALGRTNDFSDPNGHGTHVSGSVLGNGTASNGNYRGTAPKAKLIFQSLMDGNGALSGIPIALEELFEEAYGHGARIHNNSWGAATSSKYTVNSIEVDEYVNDKKDMLILIAAGNEGTANSPLHSKVGFVDWLSIGSPASSKNSLTVGASRSDRTAGGLSQLTYSQAWPGDFPDQPIASQKISGSANGIAGFSSRGPCDDQRIKPDVVAPGTDIISTKSTLAPNQNFWGNVPGNTNYAYMGGTSMACPLVSGCAALVREYYDTVQNYQEPSAALIKATLINGAQKLSGTDSIADHDATPNYHQGFGRIAMTKSIPCQQNPTLELRYIDSWKNDNLKFTRSGERFRFIVDIGPTHPLRICLAYTDIPGRALQNNINLFVEFQEENGPTFKVIGNQEFRVLPGNLHIPDPDNNVEVVRMESPNNGRCLIQLTASNLLKIDQDFALIVTGDLRSNLIQM